MFFKQKVRPPRQNVAGQQEGCMPSFEGGEALFAVGPKGAQDLHLSCLIKRESCSICLVLCCDLPHTPDPKTS